MSIGAHYALRAAGYPLLCTYHVCVSHFRSRLGQKSKVSLVVCAFFSLAISLLCSPAHAHTYRRRHLYVWQCRFEARHSLLNRCNRVARECVIVLDDYYQGWPRFSSQRFLLALFRIWAAIISGPQHTHACVDFYCVSIRSRFVLIFPDCSVHFCFRYELDSRAVLV